MESCEPTNHNTLCLGYLLPFVFPLLVILGLTLQGWWLWSAFLGIVLVGPLLSLGLMKFDFKPRIDTQSAKNEKIYYRTILVIYVALHLILIITSALLVGLKDFSAVEFLGLLLSLGTAGGIGIALAHELMHNVKNKFDKFVAKTFLSFMFLIQFYTEHLKVHHNKNITCTDEDPVFAAKGTSVYGFIFRGLPAVMISAWQCEATNLKRDNLKVISWHNTVLRYTVISIIVALLLTLISSSLLTLLFFILQSMVSTTYLMANDYIQHYGLQRRKMPDGSYEPFYEYYSWNSTDIIGNYLLAQLPKHSAHHDVPYLRYETVEGGEMSAVFPYPYLVMLMMAFITPLWWKVMDPKVDGLAESLPKIE